MDTASEDAAAMSGQAVSSNSPDLSTPPKNTTSETLNTLKRKQSSNSIETEPSNKKARVSPEPAPQPGDIEIPQDQTGEFEQQKPSHTNRDKQETAEDSEKQPPANQSPPSETTRPRKSQQPVDERKRNRRLFGAVFGALGQNASPQLAKRREIDKKQREKLRAQAEEDDTAREARLARLTEARKKEQKRFDRQSMRIRHDNIRAMATSLRTKAEPRLYYRPWSLRPDQEDTIDRQVKETEEHIAKELAEYDEAERREEQDVKEDRPLSRDGGHKNDSEEAQVSIPAQEDVQMDGTQSEPDAGSSKGEQQEETSATLNQEKLPEEALPKEKTEDTGVTPGPRDEPDHADDEEGDIDGDDAVIY